MGRIAICLLLASAAACGTPSSPTSPPSKASPAREAGSGPQVGSAREARESGSAPETADLPSVIGVWRGTSLCTVRPSPCHDETVVYYVSGADRDHILAVANKIVDGKEEEMGRLECRLGPERRLVCQTERGVFGFAIDGNRMHGKLDLLDGTRYRVIEVERVR